MIRRARSLALVVVAVSACAPPPDEPDADAGPAPTTIENAFEIELGTGRETFQPLDDGDTIYLEAGFQGAQHVLASVRVALPEGRYLSDFTLVRADGTQLSEPSRVRVPYAESAPEGAALLGYRVVVGNDEVDNAVGEDATLQVVVEDADGGAALDERDVHVEWAPEGWNPDAG